MNCFIHNCFSETLILKKDQKKFDRKKKLKLSMTEISRINEIKKRRDILKFAAAFSSIPVFGSQPVSAEKMPCSRNVARKANST